MIRAEPSSAAPTGGAAHDACGAGECEAALITEICAHCGDASCVGARVRAWKKAVLPAALATAGVASAAVKAATAELNSLEDGGDKSAERYGALLQVYNSASDALYVANAKAEAAGASADILADGLLAAVHDTNDGMRNQFQCLCYTDLFGRIRDIEKVCEDLGDKIDGLPTPPDLATLHSVGVDTANTVRGDMLNDIMTHLGAPISDRLLNIKRRLDALEAKVAPAPSPLPERLQYKDGKIVMPPEVSEVLKAAAIAGVRAMATGCALDRLSTRAYDDETGEVVTPGALKMLAQDMTIAQEQADAALAVMGDVRWAWVRKQASMEDARAAGDAMQQAWLETTRAETLLNAATAAFQVELNNGTLRFTNTTDATSGPHIHPAACACDDCYLPAVRFTGVAADDVQQLHTGPHYKGIAIKSASCRGCTPAHKAEWTPAKHEEWVGVSKRAAARFDEMEAAAGSAAAMVGDTDEELPPLEAASAGSEGGPSDNDVHEATGMVG